MESRYVCQWGNHTCSAGVVLYDSTRPLGGKAELRPAAVYSQNLGQQAQVDEINNSQGSMAMIEL